MMIILIDQRNWHLALDLIYFFASQFSKSRVLNSGTSHLQLYEHKWVA